MSSALMGGIVVTVVAAAGMLAARLLGAKVWWHFLLGGTLAVAAAGAWMASVTTALSTAETGSPLLQGAAIGAGLGFFSSGVILACLALLTRAAKSTS